ncbi:hypothetical protein F5ESL0245_00630 [Lactobacillus sp. ESL0245]|nr:hypothetical protein F5ESL0247_00630 [Lactobacillus sp. ESL0247]RMC29741.1 hypothetical protein F5ESL0246_00630 [Lactobacillus sp. ESL0246]RMC34146.1 hypothetical protein F5ESL0245_00630 [Lactobacillus sp. ESL0245]RMC51929.1 hypothetical protein F5ESL0228_00525 [Lactobacillus sp. ESL0228]
MKLTVENEFVKKLHVLVSQKNFKNLAELEQAIREYIVYYNNERIKIKLKGLAPIKYRKLVLS